MSNLINKIDFALNKQSLFVVAVSILCLTLIGIPLLYLPAVSINPDTYQYLSIANYYLMDPAPTLRDAYTVGPVIPVLIAILKYILSWFIAWNRHVDVFMLKGMALICYLVIVISTGIHLKKSLPPIVVLTFLLLLMGLPDWECDSLSLNGELLSVGLMALLLTHLGRSDREPNIIIVCFLAVLVIYTKLQSALLLFLLLASYYYPKKERWTALLILFGSFIVIDLVLYANGTGVFRRVTDLLMYVNRTNPSPGMLTNNQGTFHEVGLSRYIVNLQWSVMWVQKFAPLFGFMVGYFVLTNQNRSGGILTDWRVWLFVLFVTIMTPGRQYGHYTIYALFFVIIFAEPVLSSLTDGATKQGAISLISLAIIVGFLAVKTSNSVTSIAESKLWLGPDIEAAASLTKQGGGRVHIHGYDYRLYTYFYGWNDGTDLSYVAGGSADPSWYLNRVLDKKYKYIVDVVGYSGRINDPLYKITDSTIYGVTLAKYYELVTNSNGLRVFRLKVAAQNSILPEHSTLN